MKRILGVVGVLLVLACPLIAQLSTSSLLGTVRDSSGAVIPGAKITATNTGTNVTRTTDSGNDGLYRIDGLQPGDYNVTIEKTGFSTEKLNALTLTVAQNAEANVALKVGSQQETVQVEADSAPQINVTSSSLGGLVNSQQVADLPLNGRNFIDLALLQPGVANSQSNSPTLLKANYFSSNGAPIRSNLTVLDGAPMVNVLGSTSSAVGTTLGIDGIQEFRVITNTPGAQYGMGMGSQIVISSKGGTNQFHGDAYDYLRNNDLDARGYFAVQEPRLVRNNFGGAFGGPIRKDKTFFFATYEGIKQIQGVTSSINTLSTTPNCNPGGNASSPLLGITEGSNPCSTVPFTYNGQNYNGGLNCTVGVNCATHSGSVNPVMAPFLLLYPLPNVATTSATPTYTQNNNQPTGVNYGQIRVDHTFSASDSIFGRFTIDKSDLLALVSFPGTIYKGVGSHSVGSDQFDTLAENHVFSSTVLNTARLSYSRTLNTNLPVNPAALAASPYQMVYNQNVWSGSVQVTAGLAGLGPTGTQPQGFNQNIYTASDDINWTKGKHAIQFGTIFNRVEYYLYDAQSIRGMLQFTNGPSLLAGAYQTVAFQPPGSNFYREPRYYTFGFYGQDDWRINSRLTLNLGLRYEPDTAPLNRVDSTDYAFHLETDPAPIHGAILRNTSFKNIEPRIGFAWDVRGDGKMSIRGGFGIYDDVNSMGQSFYGPSAGSPPASVVGQLINGTVTKLPIIDASYALPPNSMPYGQALKTTIWSVNQPTMYQWNGSIQRQLTGSTSITVAYAGSKGMNLWDNEEGNTCLPDSPNGGNPIWNSPFDVAPANVNGSGNPAGQLLNPLFGQPGTVGAGQPKYISVICTKVNNPGTANAAIATGTYPANASYPGIYNVSTRVNPLWGDWLLATTNGLSNYNAAEFSLNKRVSHGLEATVAYTFSKVMDESQGQYSISECSGSGGNPSIALQPYRRKFNYGPACFDVPQQLQASALYHFPAVNKAGFIGKELLSGWWVGNKTTWQTGFAYSPTANNWRDLSQNISSNNGYQSEYVNYGTATVTPGSTGPDGTVNSTTSTFIPFNKSTVTLKQKGLPGYVQWFNPLMFTDNPLGQLGTVHKGALRGPNFSTVDLSFNKDTALPGIGEKGALEFRLEVFNVANHSNFSVPSGYKSFAGAVTTATKGMFGEAPISTAGRTTSTVGNPRQLQLSLKLLF